MASSDESDNNGEDADNYVERLYLANSKDVVRLLLNYNLVQYFPQLQGCAYINKIQGLN